MIMRWLLSLSTIQWLSYTVEALGCSSDDIPFPNVSGAQVLSLTAEPVTNYSVNVFSMNSNSFQVNVTALSFCNVTLTYTHPGQNDTICINAWLPTNYSGRFMGVGGGGYSTGSLSPQAMAYGAGKGYATATTDGGHGPGVGLAPWALVSPGNVNLYLLQDFASVALDDLASFGKLLTTSFYGSAPDFSYWNGCSTGGRQGLMMAQRFPTQYDGILAAAPAINWAKFLVAEYWPQFIMNQLGIYPDPCSLAAIAAAAVRACDELDGVVDGVVARPELCNFNTSSMIGHNATCPDGSQHVITQAAAKVAHAAYSGPYSSTGEKLWYGLHPGTILAGLVATTCENGTCAPAPFPVANEWITKFVLKNASFDLINITQREYDRIFHASVQQFTSIIGTDDPDLSDFRDAGGKMITWHGLADQLISPDGTVDYYQRVEDMDPSVRDYYRFFEAPGVQHCGGGLGAYPGAALDALVQWVEHGTAPEILSAATIPAGRTQNLCQWPLFNMYTGGDSADALSYRCVERETSSCLTSQQADYVADFLM